MFRTFYFHLQEDYIVHPFLYGIFSMHKCVGYIPYKSVCTI